MVRQAHQPGKGFLFALYPLPLTLFPTSLRSLEIMVRGGQVASSLENPASYRSNKRG